MVKARAEQFAGCLKCTSQYRIFKVITEAIRNRQKDVGTLTFGHMHRAGRHV